MARLLLMFWLTHISASCVTKVLVFQKVIGDIEVFYLYKFLVYLSIDKTSSDCLYSKTV